MKPKVAGLVDVVHQGPQAGLAQVYKPWQPHMLRPYAWSVAKSIAATMNDVFDRGTKDPNEKKYQSSCFFEYSVKPNIEPNDIVKEWGAFRKDPLDLNMLGIKRNDAIRIFDAGGWK